MATAKKKKKSAAGSRPIVIMRANTGGKKKRKNTGSHHHRPGAKRNTGRRHKMRHNIGGGGGRMGGMSDLVINSMFVIAGALGSKLIAQMVLGANNTGVMGYGVSLLAGTALWFATDKVLKNKAASTGIISGTIVQLIIRLLNDYTPFGTYVAQLGMGDYQAQAFLTPQILVDPYKNATIKFPAALMPAPAPSAPPPSKSMPAAVGVSGFDPLYGGKSIYG
jgi:hypothetical protein